jgi:hypothetical protein
MEAAGSWLPGMYPSAALQSCAKAADAAAAATGVRPIGRVSGVMPRRTRRRAAESDARTAAGTLPSGAKAERATAGVRAARSWTWARYSVSACAVRAERTPE